MFFLYVRRTGCTNLYHCVQHNMRNCLCFWVPLCEIYRPRCGLLLLHYWDPNQRCLAQWWRGSLFGCDKPATDTAFLYLRTQNENVQWTQKKSALICLTDFLFISLEEICSSIIRRKTDITAWTTASGSLSLQFSFVLWHVVESTNQRINFQISEEEK